MGNKNLGILPRTQRWKEVVALLESGADAEAIAQYAFLAAQTCFNRIPHDIGFNQVILTAFEFTEAIRQKDFSTALWEKGFDVAANASALELVGALAKRIDQQLAQSRSRSDVADIAQSALTQTLVEKTTSQASLFEARPEHLQTALGKELRGEQFGKLMHEFYSSFVHRYLTYYLSRELPNHVGPGRRFDSSGARQEFDQALDLHVRQAVRIADEFTPGWLGRASFESRLNLKEVNRYTAIAFKKISREFQRGEDAR